MGKFTFTPLAIGDVLLIEPKRFDDTRGFFAETYNKAEFEKAGIKENFVQDNFSFSKKGVMRGLHFDLPPHEKAKLVRCISGEIIDVVVDIRVNSKTFGKWVSEVLSGENGRMIFVPKGFAHGFCVMSESALFSYKVTEYYFPESEAGIIWNDPDLGIKWGIEEPILSDKDKKLGYLKDLLK